MDFVGQHGPISKFSLLTFDILVLILQLIMMGVVQERAKTNQLLPRGASASSSGDTTTSDVSNDQDHDLEERGVRQTDTDLRHGHSSEDIELQDIPLSSSDGSRGEAEEDNERNELLAEPAEGGQSIDASAHPLDVFHSGESVIMDMQFTRTIKDQWHRSRAAGSQGTSAYASSHSYPATLFGGRFRVELRTNSRNTGTV